MRKTIVLLAMAFLCAFQLTAQTDVDVLRYSQIYPDGTARSMAMGGAFGALGGDFSSLSMNPAGIAIYRKSEFTFSPSLGDMKANSAYLGTNANDSRYNFNIGNIGLVGHYGIPNANPEGWQNIDFGIGYNRQNSFQTNITFQGTNQNNSLLDFFLHQVNGNGGTPTSDLDAENVFKQDAALAYWSYLINPDSSNSLHYNSVLPVAGERQRMTINSTGSMGEMVMSLGANYDNKLYFGATMGIDFLNYNENSHYTETNMDNTTSSLIKYDLNRTLNTSGNGINLKLGMIYRANDFLRFGLAFHTPTFYQMHDNYSATIASDFDSARHYTHASPQGTFDYTLTTPMRVIGSIAFIIGQSGVISGDYEFVDYTSSQLSSTTYNFADANAVIQQKYSQGSNFRVGTEWKVNNISLRGGYAFYGTPFSSNSMPPGGADQTTNSFSGGIGVKDHALTIDLGFVYSMTKEYYEPYFLNDQPVEGATIKLNNNIFVMTIGYKF